MRIAALILFLVPFCCRAQLGFRFANSHGNGAYESYGYATTADNAGNMYNAGSFSSIVDMDPGGGMLNFTNFGVGSSKDIYVQKLDVNGNLIWAKQIGSNAEDNVNAITIDPSGNIIHAGGFLSFCDFDPSPATYTIWAMGGTGFCGYISKLDANGNFVWAKGLVADNCFVMDVKTDASGNVFACGFFSGMVDFDPGPGSYYLTSGGFRDYFVLKLDASGNFVWAFRAGVNGDDYGYAIDTDPSGNVYVTGNFAGVVDFDPGPSTFTLNGIGISTFIQKLDNNGNFLMVKKLGGNNPSTAYAYDIDLDASGNIYTTGFFSDTVDFDPGATTYTVFSAAAGGFVSKLDPSGNFLWVRAALSPTIEYCTSLEVAPSGNIYVEGVFTGPFDLDFGPGVSNVTCSGYTDIFLCEYSPSGNFVWGKKIGGAGHDKFQKMFFNSSGLYSTGYMTGSADYDPGAGVATLNATGYWITTHKLKQCSPTTSTISVSSCGSYTAPGGTVLNSSGIYNVIIPNAQNCDSAITINLTVTVINPNVTVNGNTLTADQSGASYQWVQCPSMSPLSGGTLQSFVVPADGVYAVMMTVGSCTAVSFCYTINLTGHAVYDLISHGGIYPNPAKDELVLEDPGEGAQVRLYNLQGELVETKVIEGTYREKAVMDISNLRQGFYFLAIQRPSGKIIYKLLKE